MHPLQAGKRKDGNMTWRQRGRWILPDDRCGKAHVSADSLDNNLAAYGSPVISPCTRSTDISHYDTKYSTTTRSTPTHNYLRHPPPGQNNTSQHQCKQ